MTEKTPVKLVVSDIDNTISDYFDTWAKNMNDGINAVAASRGIDINDKEAMAEVYASILSIKTQGAIWHDFARMVREAPIFSLEGYSEEERKRLEKSDAKVAHDFQVGYAKDKKIYEGVIDTVKKMREAGTPFVLYTDSPEDGALRSLIHMGFPLDQLDGLVCRANDADEILADGSKAPMQVDGGKIAEAKKQLKARLGDNYVVNAGDAWKSKDPLPGHESESVMLGICKRFGVEPSEAVMVGDNIKSDGGFVRFDMNYAWQKKGSAVSDLASKMNSSLSGMSDYKLGPDAHLAQLKQMSEENPALGKAYRDNMVTLSGGFGDLPDYFEFVKNESYTMPKEKGRALADLSKRREAIQMRKDAYRAQRKAQSETAKPVVMAKRSHGRG